jgi:hypothetical protein
MAMEKNKTDNSKEISEVAAETRRPATEDGNSDTEAFLHFVETLRGIRTVIDDN